MKEAGRGYGWNEEAVTGLEVTIIGYELMRVAGGGYGWNEKAGTGLVVTEIGQELIRVTRRDFE